MPNYNKRHYISFQGLLKSLIPAFKKPSYYLERGVLLTSTNMLYRESLSTLLSAIFLQASETDSKIYYEIWKYSRAYEGDGRIHQIKDVGRYKVVNKISNSSENIDVEQVYIDKKATGDLTDIIIDRIKHKIYDNADRQGEVLCIFVNHCSEEGGIKIQKIKNFLKNNAKKFIFYFVITLRAQSDLNYYVYELVDLNWEVNTHHRYIIRLEPLNETYETFTSEEEYLDKFKKW